MPPCPCAGPSPQFSVTDPHSRRCTQASALLRGRSHSQAAAPAPWGIRLREPTLLLWCPTSHAAISHPSPDAPSTTGRCSSALGLASLAQGYSTAWRFPRIPQLGTKALDPRPCGQRCSQSQVQSPREAGRCVSSRQCVLTKGRASAQRPLQSRLAATSPPAPCSILGPRQDQHLRRRPSKTYCTPSLEIRDMFYFYLVSQKDILPLGGNFQRY